MARMGAPPFAWTDEIETEVLTRIASGESAVRFLGPDRDDFLPSVTTLYKHVQESSDFADKYARAREAQAHHEAEQIIAIADAATAENVQVARLRIDARKWHASKLAPKSYGDKIDHNLSGGFTVNLAGHDADL